MLALPGSAYVYQGEELGLPEHTTLPDDALEDPTWERSRHTERGRDGCRVPIPWEADAPSLGFGDTPTSWLPQPASYRALARDQQVGDPASTLEFYRRALQVRREHHLGTGRICWQPTDPAILVIDNETPTGTVTVIVNLSDTAVQVDDIAPGTVLLHSAGPDAGTTVAPDQSVWVRR